MWQDLRYAEAGLGAHYVDRFIRLKGWVRHRTQEVPRRSSAKEEEENASDRAGLDCLARSRGAQAKMSIRS